MAELPTRLELDVGERSSFELPGSGVSGYVWDHEVIGPDDVADVQWSRGFSEGVPPRTAGVGAPEVVTVVARRPGTVEMRLTQHRRWEPPERFLAEHRVDIVVREPGPTARPE